MILRTVNEKEIKLDVFLQKRLHKKAGHRRLELTRLKLG